MNIAKSLFFFAIAISLTSCMRNIKPETIGEVVQGRDVLDGQTITVKGYIIVDALYAVNFVPELGSTNGDRVTKSIDLNPSDKQIARLLPEFNGKCVVVDGIFRRYGAHRIPFGNLVSEYGDVDVKNIRKCEK